MGTDHPSLKVGLERLPSFDNSRALTNGLAWAADRNWIEIDLKQLRVNLAAIRAVSPTPAFLVVKANAYGHGDLGVVRELCCLGERMFAVGSPMEALRIKAHAPSARVLVLGYSDPEALDVLISARVELCVSGGHEVKLISDRAKKLKLIARLHLWVDLGMARFGCKPDQALKLLQGHSDSVYAEIYGLGGHLPSAGTDIQGSRRCLELFAELVAFLHSKNARPCETHVLASAGVLQYREYGFDAVRIGRLLYGIGPISKAPAVIRPLLRWRCKIESIVDTVAGQEVGYGGEFKSANASRIATIAIGYSDGYRSSKENTVLVNGKPCCVVGRLCSQHALIELPPELEAAVGDSVTLLGSDGVNNISLAELATRWQLSELQVVCSLGESTSRRYL